MVFVCGVSTEKYPSDTRNYVKIQSADVEYHLTTGKITATAGEGVLPSLVSEKFDIMASNTPLSVANAKIQADFTFPSQRYSGSVVIDNIGVFVP